MWPRAREEEGGVGQDCHGTRLAWVKTATGLGRDYHRTRLSRDHTAMGQDCHWARLSALIGDEKNEKRGEG